MIGELKADAQAAKFEEKAAQEDYVELMKESQEKRAADLKAIGDQESAKAELESTLAESKENQQLTLAEAKNVQDTLSKLHGTCDFILKNFEVRAEARNAEIEGLKN